MDRLRRTMMFVPGNLPGMMRDAHIYGADSLMFDLEDSVALSEKDAARLLVYHSLKSINYGGCELVVRVNPLSTPYGLQDLNAMIRAGVHVVRLPKTETAEDVLEMEAAIDMVERDAGVQPGRTKLMAAIEGAMGVLNAQSICTASERLVAVALGAEDYCANLKTSRTKEGMELFFARCAILNAARAAGISAIDTVFSDVDDIEGFENEVRLIRQLGFDGKSIINPRQVAPVNKAFTPGAGEIEHARRIIDAMEESRKRGSGVTSLNGRMVDRPVVLRAERTLMMARASGVLYDEEV